MQDKYISLDPVNADADAARARSALYN
jgi:hypothetical protein